MEQSNIITALMLSELEGTVDDGALSDGFLIEIHIHSIFDLSGSVEVDLPLVNEIFHFYVGKQLC